MLLENSVHDPSTDLLALSVCHRKVSGCHFDAAARLRPFFYVPTPCMGLIGVLRDCGNPVAALRATVWAGAQSQLFVLDIASQGPVLALWPVLTLVCLAATTSTGSILKRHIRLAVFAVICAAYSGQQAF